MDEITDIKDIKWERVTIKCEYVGWCGWCKEQFKTYEEMAAHVCEGKTKEKEGKNTWPGSYVTLKQIGKKL